MTGTSADVAAVSKRIIQQVERAVEGEAEVERVQVDEVRRLGQRQVLRAVGQELVGRPQGFEPELISVRRAEVGDREACRGRQALGASGCRRGARRGGCRRSDHLPLDEELAHVGLVQSTTAQRR